MYIALTLIAVYIIGFMLSVFIFNLFFRNEREDDNIWMVPCSLFWFLALPGMAVFWFFVGLYAAPEWLAKHCNEKISKWGK